jgi:hypothetical protein
MSLTLDMVSRIRYISGMKVWERLSTVALWPVTRVPWGMDRGVSDEEFARYRRDFRGGFIAFFASLIFVEALGNHVPALLRYVLALLPFFTSAFVVTTLVRYVAHWDELQRRIVAEAGALAAAAGIGLLLTYNYLMDMGLPAITPKWIVAVFALLWLVALPLVRKHYEA